MVLRDRPVHRVGARLARVEWGGSCGGASCGCGARDAGSSGGETRAKKVGEGRFILPESQAPPELWGPTL